MHHSPYANCYRCPFNLQYPSCGIACAEHLRNVAAYRAIVHHAPQVVPNGQVENPPISLPDAATPALPKAAAHRKHGSKRLGHR